MATKDDTQQQVLGREEEMPISPTNRIGRWTQDEHERFVEAYSQYGKKWKKIALYVGTRNNIQCRTHSQNLKSFSNEEGDDDNNNNKEYKIEDEEEEAEESDDAQEEYPQNNNTRGSVNPLMYLPLPSLLHMPTTHSLPTSPTSLLFPIPAASIVGGGSGLVPSGYLVSPMLLQHQQQLQLQLQQQQLQQRQQFEQHRQFMAASGGFFNAQFGNIAPSHIINNNLPPSPRQ